MTVQNAPTTEAPKDNYGRLLDECPQSKRKQYPPSPECCGVPMTLYFAWSVYEGTELRRIGGHLLRCSKCGQQEDVDLLITQLAGTWFREVL